jgi:hypothetical protein
MKRPPKEIRINMLENLLAQYEQQHEILEHDAIAATATGAEDAEEAVEKLREQQRHIRAAHEAITMELRKEKEHAKKTKTK